MRPDHKIRNSIRQQPPYCTHLHGLSGKDINLEFQGSGRVGLSLYRSSHCTALTFPFTQTLALMMISRGGRSQRQPEVGKKHGNRICAGRLLSWAVPSLVVLSTIQARISISHGLQIPRSNLVLNLDIIQCSARPSDTDRRLSFFS
jgi:hypothetical protein